MLLSQEQVTEFELRHFTGKALFNLAFRRPAMSIFESVFYGIEALSRSGEPGHLSAASRDEIFMVVALAPLLRMNLRANPRSRSDHYPWRWWGRCRFFQACSGH